MSAPREHRTANKVDCATIHQKRTASAGGAIASHFNITAQANAAGQCVSRSSAPLVSQPTTRRVYDLFDGTRSGFCAHSTTGVCAALSAPVVVLVNLACPKA